MIGIKKSEKNWKNKPENRRKDVLANVGIKYINLWNR
jgi:hypothetical protein